jgi:hypothetical protein
MLKIRKEQMDIFSELMLKKFEDYLVAHIQNDFAEQVKETPEDALRATIQKGLSKAERYNIRIEYNIERYIDLMFILGDDFDTAEKTQWVGELLRNEQMPALERINRIYYHLEEN